MLRKIRFKDEQLIFYVDGISLVIVLKIIGINANRVSFDMTSIAPVVFEYCQKNNLSVYILGGEEGIAQSAVDVFKKNYPSLNVIGCHSGFFESKQYRSSTIHNIANMSPNVVIAGMGAPYQEQFLLDLKNAGWKGEGYTCGGFLHQTASQGIEYYPNWINRLNLRWLYRMYDEPKLVKRYFIYYPWFLFVFFFDVVKYKLSKDK